MQEELNQFERIKIRTVVPRLTNQPIRGIKWVFRNKFDEYGIIVRNKAKLVVERYSRKEEIYFDESFVSVAQLKIIRMLLPFE